MTDFSAGWDAFPYGYPSRGAIETSAGACPAPRRPDL